MIELDSVVFSYSNGGFRLHVPSLHVSKGERVAVIGPSGSGKTTLTYLIAGILRATEGACTVAGTELAKLSERGRREFRSRHVGFVFQEFELLDYLSIRDNILLPFMISRALNLNDTIRKRASMLAEGMQLGDKLARYPRSLSQGERQRVSICRALITSPPLLIADEPTGNLDPATASTILEILRDEVQKRDATLLMVTHNHDLLSSFDRTIDVSELATEAHA